MKKRKRIAVDMDEVLAKYTTKVIKLLKEETGFTVDMNKVTGGFLSKYLPPKYLELVTTYPHREGFFRDLEVMENAPEILSQLQKTYDIYIVSATNQHLNAPKSKIEWLQEHFQFIPYSNIVFSGDKSVIRADYLVDDHPRHLERFEGRPLLFEAFHNINEKRFKRFKNWEEAGRYFLGT